MNIQEFELNLTLLGMEKQEYLGLSGNTNKRPDRFPKHYGTVVEYTSSHFIVRIVEDMSILLISRETGTALYVTNIVYLGYTECKHIYNVLLEEMDCYES